ncbi:MAG: DUF4382 domain-containing protein [Chloroflexota bacterium]|nr:DUF4382 domain-containing protein [Chloroflexota bacterium]
MSNSLDIVLDECIDRMSRGQSLDECLTLYPEFAAELEPLLRTITDIYNQSSSLPSESAMAKGRMRLHQAMYDIDQVRRETHASWFQKLFGQPKIWAPAMALILIAFVVSGLATVLWDNESPSGTTAIATPPVTSPEHPIVASAGILEIRVTDAPNHDISAVYMTINNIEVHRSQSKSAQGDNQTKSYGSEWENVISESQSFELLALRGIEEVLGSKELEAGHYTQIRLDVEEVSVIVDGETHLASIPGDKLKLVRAFNIEAGERTALTMDFDAEKSVIVTGKGKVMFKPTVKVIVRQVPSEYGD